MDIYDYYGSLSRPQRVLFRQRLIKEADISISAFYKKLSDKSFTKAETFLIKHLINTDRKSWAG